MVGNVIFGIAGAALAGIIFPRLVIFTGFDFNWSVMSTTIGVVILLLLVLCFGAGLAKYKRHSLRKNLDFSWNFFQLLITDNFKPFELCNF